MHTILADILKSLALRSGDARYLDILAGQINESLISDVEVKSRYDVGAARFDAMSGKRVIFALRAARFDSGKWSHIDGTALTAARAFAGV